MFYKILKVYTNKKNTLYVVTLQQRIPKWAHLPPNSKRLDFCGCCRDGLTREKSAITEEKWPKNGPKFDISNLSPPGEMAKKAINDFVASF